MRLRPDWDGKVNQQPPLHQLSSVMSAEAIVSGGVLGVVSLLTDNAEVSSKTLVSKTREGLIQLQTCGSFPLW